MKTMTVMFLTAALNAVAQPTTTNKTDAANPVIERTELTRVTSPAAKRSHLRVRRAT